MTDFQRFRVISETRGLVWTGGFEDDAERIACMVAINTGHTVYLHDTQAA